jgi:hypothetical protein
MAEVLNHRNLQHPFVIAFRGVSHTPLLLLLLLLLLFL